MCMVNTMVISKREKEIIEILCKAQSAIRMEEIADSLHVSARTIYREIPQVTQYFQSYGLELQTISKKGLLIHGDTSQILKDLHSQTDLEWTSADMRMDAIFLYLALQEDYIKAEAIAYDNQVSVSTVRKDIDSINEKLKESDCSIQTKKGNGYLLEGSLIDKNHLIMNCLLRNIKEENLIFFLEGKEESGNIFLKRIEHYYLTIQTCHVLLKEILQGKAYFGDHEYILFLLLLSFMIQARIDEKPYSEIGKIQLDDRKDISDIVKRINACFAMCLTLEEQDYIQWAIYITVHQKDNELDLFADSRLNRRIHEFVAYVEEHMGIHLPKDSEMIMGLYVHMDKAIHRIRSGISVSNPLAQQTKEEYKELFEVISQGLKEVFADLYFPDDEIGYLLFYFAVALDQVIKRAFKILVVCSGGMGSSRMLASRVMQEIPEVRIEKVTSLIELSTENLENYDLILSTIPLYIDKSRYMLVSPLLNNQELQRVRDEIRRHKYGKLRKIDQRELAQHRLQKANSVEKLAHINRLSTAGLNLVGKFLFYDYSEYKNPFEDMCQTLEKNGFDSSKIVNEDFDSVFLIPTTKILYCEKRIEALPTSICFVHRYQENIFGFGEEYQFILYFLNPAEIQKFEKEMLFHLIQMLLEDKDALRYIETGKQEKAQEMMAYQINSFIQIFIGL